VAASRAGELAGRSDIHRCRPSTRLGRGFAATRLKENALGPRSRRVAIKARIVHLQRTGSDAAAAHLRYIARDGVSRDDRSPNRPYDATGDDVDLDAFRARGSKDRHQFRFIISPEDGTDLVDLRAFTRDLMERVSGDLGTQLDWVAVDHWDTDNPHTHLVLRGRDGSGRDLVIAGEYIARGMRVRASELATSWLGPRTRIEIQATLHREVEEERWTSLDRQLKFRTRDGRVDLDVNVSQSDSLPRRTQLIGRLRYLENLGLARQSPRGDWELRPDAEDVLRRLGERGDVIRTMQRTFGESQRELTIFDPAASPDAVVGRIASKGLVDELGDRSFVVVDGIDGRAHYVTLPSATALQDLPLGGILEVRQATARVADRNIVAASTKGLYVPRSHVAELRATAAHREFAADIVASHVRRLEALRRDGIVERVGDGLWRIPADLVARGQAYDRRRDGGLSLRLRCHLPIERQIRAIGATWLDELLVDGRRQRAAVGFAVGVGHALDSRRDFLAQHGFAQRRGDQLVLSNNLLDSLRQAELNAAAKALSAETGRSYRPTREGVHVKGLYRRSIQLVSGRFAMLDDGLGFSLVPWRPVLEGRLGKNIRVAIRGDHVVWHLGRVRTPSVG